MLSAHSHDTSGESASERAADRLGLTIPQEIRAYKQWLLWRYEPGEDKPRKIPYYINGNKRSGAQGGQADLSQMTTFDAAVSALRASTFDGLGLAILENSPIKAIDIDNCVEDHKLSPDAEAIVREADSYAELSPSGHGVRILVLGVLPSKKALNHFGPGEHLELFGTSGFVTVTGNILGDAAIRPMAFAFQAWITKKVMGEEPRVESPLPILHVEDRQLFDIRAALNYLDADDYAVWIDCGMCLKSLGDVGRGLWLEWSQQSPRYDAKQAALKWRSFEPTGKISYQTIFFRASEKGWINPEKTNVKITSAPSAAGLVLTVSELHAKASAVRWAVKGVIAEQSLGFIYGASGTFKSFVALDYALHRCYGMKWLGRRTKSSVAVYLAAEGGAGLMRRIEAWHRHRGMVWQDCPLLVVIVPLTLRTHSKTLREAVQACGANPGDVIVDTMSQTFTGNENSNDEVADFLRVLGSELRDALACTVTVVHHSGHSATERPRGASAIIANVDFAFGVFRDEKEMLCTMEFLKVKDGERPDPVSFDMTSIELGTDEDGDAITSLVAGHLVSQEALADAVQREGIAGRGGRNQLLLGLVQSGMKERELRKLFYDQVNLANLDAKKHAYYRARDWAVKGAFIDLAQGFVIDLKGDK